jgi:hypothetical protein
MEVARKMPPKGTTERYLDEKIAEMGRKELEEYISKKTTLLPAPRLTEDTTDDILDPGTNKP